MMSRKSTRSPGSNMMFSPNHFDPRYTAVYNLLDYASCVFPVTFVDPNLDATWEGEEWKDYQFGDEKDKAFSEICESSSLPTHRQSLKVDTIDHRRRKEMAQRARMSSGGGKKAE